MKTIKRLGLVALTALSVVLTSCSSDDGESGPVTSSLDTYINATVAGAAFETFSMQGFSAGTATKSGTGESTFISITGIAMTAAGSTDTRTITMILEGITATGTYQINAESRSVLAYFDSASSIAWDTSSCDAATATVTVTAYTDTKIEGTFSFTGVNDENCSDTKVVTNGSFRGTYAN